jgi:hypothetical protein
VEGRDGQTSAAARRPRRARRRRCDMPEYCSSELPTASPDSSATSTASPSSSPRGRPPPLPSWRVRALVAIWVLVHIGMLVRGLAPAPRPWAAPLPWSMFRVPPAAEATIVAESLDPSGQWLEIPLRSYFHFTRGWTDRRVPDTSRFLSQPGHADERAAFARWLAAKKAAAGTPVRAVRLLRRSMRGRAVDTRLLGQFEVSDAAPP